MTQPIAPRDPWTFDDAAAPPWLPWPSSLPPRDVSELPDSGGGLPSGLAPDPSAVVAAPEQPVPTGAAVMAQRLDAFLELATPTFHTSEGDISVPIPFRMNTLHGAELAHTDGRAATLVNAGHRAGMTDYAIGLVTAGRGTPAQVTSVTQELLDEGLLPSGPRGTLAQRVRKMIFDYRAGLDCAGYVQQAFLAAHGVTRAAAGLRAPLVENLSGLGDRGYKRVPVEDVRTGDLFIFRPSAPTPNDPNPVGHTTVVRDSHATPAAELDMLTQTIGLSPEVAANGRWTTILVDSSWGNSGVASLGGVSRRSLWHDTVSSQWIWTGDAGSIMSGRLPYRHVIDGIYRAKGK
jgi:hypothetical protein